MSRACLLALALLGFTAVTVAWLVAERHSAASCSAFARPGTEVWLALGQSNAANHAEVRYFTGPRVGTLDGNTCHPARDPLPGADGGNGSLWTLLAQAWVNGQTTKRVLIAVVAEASTSISDWAPGGHLHRRATNKIRAIERRGLRVTRILWVQGEADVILGTARSNYNRGLLDTLEPLQMATEAPVFISLIGRCGDAVSSGIRSAQNQMIKDKEWALAGPDLDRIGPQGRFERCHFARGGQTQAVALWLAAMRSADNKQVAAGVGG